MDVKQGCNMLGRRLEFFKHNTEKEWGYAKDQTDTFALLFPKDYDSCKRYPLYVVFHSAGHDVFSCVSLHGRKGNHDIYTTPEGMFGLYLDCYTNTKDTTDWWWGGMNAQEDEITERSTTETQPVEKRCISTIEYVLNNYPIDRNRIYGGGNSMGGSGVLGVALPRGDIFAAIKANVPAGVRHAADRCLLDKEGEITLPDPPIVVDYSAQNDEWSRGHEVLYNGMAKRHYALMGFWGMYGHANNNDYIKQFNDLVHAFDIFSVRKNEAYPVFTNATSDDPIPWPRDLLNTKAGQVNAFFRWEVLQDTADCFAIRLRLLKQDEWESRVIFPTSSVADVSLRRLQSFLPVKGQKVAWFYGEKSGTLTFDGDVLTIPALAVTADGCTLKLTK